MLKYLPKKSPFIKEGNNTIILEEEFELQIATLTDMQVKEINMMYNATPDAL